MKQPEAAETTPAPTARAAMSAQDVARVRGETMCDERTIRRWMRGEKVHESSRMRIARAAAKFGIRVQEERRG